MFCHFSSIKQASGYKSLEEGQVVEYSIIQGEKGPQAADVVKIEPIIESKPKVESTAPVTN